MAVYSARQSTYTTGDTVTAAHTNNEFNAILAAFHVSTGHTHDGTTAGDGGPLSTLYSNAVTMGTGADTDIVLTFNANSNDGVLTWMEDEDYFKFSDDILINSTEKLYFYDTAIYIQSSTDGQLDLVADTEIQIAATTIDMNGNVDVSGTLSWGSLSDGSVTITDIADEDNMSSNSATKLATQQSIKAYVDTAITAEDLDVTSDSGTIAIDLDSETLTIAGGTGLASSATSNTVTLAIDSTVTTLTGSQTLTNKTLTSPVLNTGVSGTAIADEDNMSSDSATKLATQQSIKAYVDSEVGGVSSSWVLEDDDGTEVTVASGKEVKFIGSGLTTNWTDTDNGTDGDPYDLTFTVDAAQTGITSLLATDIKIGEDNETKIDFETANEIHFYANNTEQVYLADNIFGPQSDSDVDLGTTGVRWKDAYIDTITTTGAITVGGDLTVNGTTTTVNSTTITVDDPIFTLGGDSAPGSDDNKDRGIEFRWHNGSAAKVGFFGYDDSASVFTFIPDASNSSEVFSGTVGNVAFGNIAGTLTTAAQTNITSVGALDGGSITSGFGAIDTGSSTITTTGLISGGSLDIDNVLINGTTIGHTDDTDLMTLSNGGLVVAGTLEATGNITGTLATAAQTNITSTGALDGGSITSGFGAIDTGSSTITTTGLISGGSLDIDDVLINGTTIGHTDDTDLLTLASGALTVAGTIEGTTITASTAVVPDASGGANLGSASLEWGDLYIADDKKIYLGSDQNLSIEYDEDGNDTTAIVAAGGLSMAPHGSSAGNGTELRFQELAANGAHYVGFKAPDSIAANKVFVLPNADGAANQVLKTDGSLALSWVDQAGGGTVSLVADGAVTAGKPVVLTSAGKAQQVGYTDSSVVTASNGSAGTQERGTNNITRPSTVYDTNSDRFVTAYADDGNSGYGTAVVHTISNATTGAITYGTPVVYESADSDLGSDGTKYAAFDSTANRVVIAYRDMGDSNKGKAVVGSVTAGTNAISFGTPVEFEAGSTGFINTVYHPNVDRIAIFYRDNDDSGYGKGIVGTVTAGTNAIAFGTAGNFHAGESNNMAVAYEPDTHKILVCYDDRAGGDTGEGLVATVTGGTTNSIAYGSTTQFNAGVPAKISMDYDTTANKFVMSYTDEGNSNYPTVIVGTISGTSVSFGSEVVMDSVASTDRVVLFDPDLERTMLVYTDTANGKMKLHYIGLSGTTPSSKGSLDIATTDTAAGSVSAAYDTDNNKFVVMYADSDDDLNGMMINANFGTNLTTSNFLGMAAESISDTATGKITINGGINENQSSLTIGTNYFATDAGLVATTGTQLIGKAVAADKIQVGVKSGTVAHNTVALDANAKLPAVDGSQLTSLPANPSETGGYTFVADGAISAAGKSVAITSEGKVKEIFDTDTASLGSEQVLYDGRTILGTNYFQVKSGVYDSEAERVVICYVNSDDSKFYAVVLNVSTSSMTAGTPVEVDAGTPSHYCVGYDSNTDRVVVFFQDPSNSSYGTARVGTVTAGTNAISFGTAAVFESGTSEYIASAFDTTANKLGVFYSDGGDSDKGKGIVGTVTGGTTNTIAFGSATEFESGATKSVDATFMPNREKCAVFYSDNGNSTRLTATAATISGTSVSFTTPQQMATHSSWDASVNYHPQSEHALVTWYNDDQDDRVEVAMAAMNSSGSLSFTSVADGTTTASDHIQNVVDTQSGMGVVIYRDTSDSGKTKLKPLTLASDGSSITVGSPTTVENGHGSGTYGESYPQYPSMVYDNSVRRVVTYFDANGTLGDYTSSVGGNLETKIYKTALTSNEEDFIGIAQGAVSSGANVDVKFLGQIDSNQTGLTTGTNYYLSGSTVTATVSGNTKIGRAISATKILITNAG